MSDNQFGPYQLLEEIGKGGMATVYRAYQASVDRYVALKVIHKTIANDEIALERFRHEARLIARLEHLYILPVHDFDGTHEPPYLVMRFMENGTLKDLLARRRLTFNEVGLLLQQVAAALDYAHSQGIVHRDIKPSNIMLDRQGNAIVSDFGIARMFGGIPSNDPESGSVVGTPDYIPPEQVMEDTDIDGRADVYSLGVSTFEILTGQLPFTGDTQFAVMMKQVQELPPSAKMLNANLPDGVDKVLNKALAKKNTERFETAGEFATAMLDVLKFNAAAQTFLIPPFITTAQTVFISAEQNKVITMICGDITEYVQLVEATRGAEAAQQAQITWWERAKEIVEQQQGILLTHSETNGIAAWGVTATHESDAEHAIHAALDWQNALRELGKTVFVESADEPLPLKIGINTGLTLLNLDQATGVHTASGAAVILAQRLAEDAEGAIRISSDTFREIYGIFDMLPDEPLKVRGKKEKVETYRVVKAKTRSLLTEQRQGVEGVETHLIGREAELKQLQNAFLNAIEDNETQVVTVLGEAGLGKSRLLEEFGKWHDLRPEELRLFRGRATPAITQRPYALLRDVLSFRFEIFDDDPEAVVLQKLETGVADILQEPDVETAHLLGHLAGLNTSTSPYINGLAGEPKQLATRARQLFLRFFARLGKLEPAIIELEDLHHADDASLDVFAELIENLHDLPLLVIFTARPELLERRPNWGTGQNFHTRLNLQPLDKRASRELVREILKKLPDVPKTLRDLLVERSEGNPLFIEELIKMLIEDHVIRKNTPLNATTGNEIWSVEESRLAGLRVPPSLHSVLQSRLDTLLYQEKLVLQRASVVGRMFMNTQIAALDKIDQGRVSDLQSSLRVLETRGFIQQRATKSFVGATEYIFAQAMMRDMLYNTLLERQRKTYHAGLARWFTATERAEEFLPLIAEHYEKAGEKDNAAQTLKRAGDAAMRLSAFANAKRFFEQSQTFNSNSSIYSKLAEANYHLSNFPAARSSLQSALELATTDTERAAALTLLGDIQSNTGDYAGAQTTLEEAISLTRATHDLSGLAHALEALGGVYWRLGNLDLARNHLNESLNLARSLNDTTRIIFVLNRLGGVYHQIDLKEAERLGQETYKLATSVGNRERAMVALNNLGVLSAERGDNEAAKNYYQQALARAHEIGAQQSSALYHLNIGNTNTRLGNLDEARVELRDGLTLAYRLGALPHVVSAITKFASLAFAEGNTIQALALFGLAQNHPAFTSAYKRSMEQELTKWALDTKFVETGLAKGAELDFEKTVEKLISDGKI